MSGLAIKTVAAGAVRRIKVPLLTSRTIGAPPAAIWLAPPPRSGRAAAFCGATATAPRPSAIGAAGGAAVWAAAGEPPNAAKISGAARPASGKVRIRDLETQVATRY